MAGSGAKVARVYLRVSTVDQDLARQENIVAGAKACRSTPPRTFRASRPLRNPDRTRSRFRW